MKQRIIKSIISMAIIIAMTVGMAVSFRKPVKADNKYYITFVGCGGVMNDPGQSWHGKDRYTVKPYTEPFPLPEYRFVKEGYTQIGWTTNPSKPKVVEYKAGDKITRTRDMTFYAVYEPKTYTITCQSARYIRGETGVKARVNVPYDSCIISNKLPQPEKGYYRWWYYASTGKQVASNDLVKKSEAIYYVDKPNKSVATFKVNGTAKVVSVETGKDFNYFFTAPSVSNSDFIGWSETSDGSSGVYLPYHKLVVEGSYKTYYPIYVHKSDLTMPVTYIVDKNDLNTLSEYMTKVLNSAKNANKSSSSLPNWVSVTGLFGSEGLSLLKLKYASKVVAVISTAFSLSVKTTADGAIKIDTPLMEKQLEIINKARNKLSTGKTCKISVSVRYNWDAGVFYDLSPTVKY